MFLHLNIKKLEWSKAAPVISSGSTVLKGAVDIGVDVAKTSGSKIIEEAQVSGDEVFAGKF